MRTALNLNNIASVPFQGTALPLYPCTQAEIEAWGFKAYSIKSDYQETTDPCSWEARSMRAMKTSQNVWLHGEAGGGKNLIWRQYSARTNRPLFELSFKEGASIASYITRQDIIANNGVAESVINKGQLYKAVQGLPIRRMGKIIRVPFVVVLSDLDRARPEDLEIIREALEIATGEGYLTCPVSGELIEVCKGTQFVATANSGVDGSEAGMLANPIDASIGNRFSIGINTPSPTEEWELDLLVGMFTDEVKAQSVSRKYTPSEESTKFDHEGNWLGATQPSRKELKAVVDCCRASKKASSDMMIEGMAYSVRTSISLVEVYQVNVAELGENHRNLAFSLACEDVLAGKLALPENKEAIKASYFPYHSLVESDAETAPCDLF